MALSEDGLAQLRRMIAEPDEANGYTDEMLLAGAEAYFDGEEYDLRAYAASIWEEKATHAADFVNVSESGSSRSLSQVFDHYMALAARFRTPVTPETPAPASGPRSMRIVRPVRGA